MKFSIVTPTRNSLPNLIKCIGSVRGQAGATYEHLVMDACSTDGTPAWLSQQKDIQWVSEPDAGMYDAINKGWSRADGEILCWLNSDEQYLPDTLNRVHDFFVTHSDIDFLYGDAIVVDGRGDVLCARREIRLSELYIANTFLNAMSCTLFFRRRLWDDGLLKLDARYRYAADMDMILRLLKEKRTNAKVPGYLSTFGMDGSNLSCHPRMLTETSDIQKKYGAFVYRPLRNLVHAGRIIERFIFGSYRRTNVDYMYALDEKPSYRHVSAQRVGGSYSTPRVHVR